MSTEHTQTQPSLILVQSSCMYMLCLPFCQFETNQRQTDQAPNLWDLTWPEGWFMDAQNNKKLLLFMILLFVRWFVSLFGSDKY